METRSVFVNTFYLIQIPTYVHETNWILPKYNEARMTPEELNISDLYAVSGESREVCDLGVT